MIWLLVGLACIAVIFGRETAQTLAGLLVVAVAIGAVVFLLLLVASAERRYQGRQPASHAIGILH